MSDTKICTACDQPKPISEFYPVRTSRDGLCTHCKSCYGAAQRRRHHANRERRLAQKRAYNAAHLEERRLKARDYIRGPSTRENRRRHKLKVKYRITESDYEQMFEAQRGLCAICSTPMEKASGNDGAKIDHCHQTGAVRGLLCHKCNVGLGWFQDSVSNLQAAAEYLRRPNLVLQKDSA